MNQKKRPLDASFLAAQKIEELAEQNEGYKRGFRAGLHSKTTIITKEKDQQIAELKRLIDKVEKERQYWENKSSNQ